MYLVARPPISLFKLIAVAAIIAAAPMIYFWSADHRAIQLAMNDDGHIIRFSIPSAYLSFYPNDGLTSTFAMYVVYPTMRPLSETNKHTGDPDVLRILLLSHGGASWTAKEAIEAISNDLTLVAQSDEFNTYVHHGVVSKWDDKISLVEEYLVPKHDVPSEGFFLNALENQRILRLAVPGQSLFSII